MTTSLWQSGIPLELRAVYRQFEQWRRIRHPSDRIPDRLWAAAATVARTRACLGPRACYTWNRRSLNAW
jgi:hypothetical protein